jgi:hypothetical protein
VGDRGLRTVDGRPLDGSARESDIGEGSAIPLAARSERGAGNSSRTALTAAAAPIAGRRPPATMGRNRASGAGSSQLAVRLRPARAEVRADGCRAQNED